MDSDEMIKIDKKEKLLIEESNHNEEGNRHDAENAQIEIMKQYNSNGNSTNYNIYNTVKIDNRTLNITSVGSQFVTNSYNNDEVFNHKSTSLSHRKMWILLLLFSIIAVITVIIVLVVR